MTTALTSLGLNVDALQQLQLLMQVNLDCRDGFQQAAKLTRSPEFQRLAEEAAVRHERQAAGLQNILWSNFDDSEVSGSVTASVHRVWMGLETSCQECDAAVFDEAVKMHRYVREQYETVLERVDGRAVRQMLVEHLSSAVVSERQLDRLRATLCSA